MRFFHHKKNIAALLFILSGCALFLGTDIPVALEGSSDEVDTVSTTSHAGEGIIPEAHAEMDIPPAYFPARVSIPAIGVDARIQHVGRNKKGDMAVPGNFTDAGWYKYGSVPGHEGSAVLAGHYDNGLGLPAVFYRVNDLVPGDEIFVEDGAGGKQKFVVVESALYPKSEVPTEEIFSTTGVARIVLITCEGAWVSHERTYADRRIVTAILH